MKYPEGECFYMSNFLMISDLISQLTEVRKNFGEIPVVIAHSNSTISRLSSARVMKITNSDVPDYEETSCILLDDFDL